ncbi:MAG: peptidylprolyl isomerase [Desulfobacterota bacterium]|nr:peptidylprolyl isomerase [Thermodesulfobacteriota bacterium]
MQVRTRRQCLITGAIILGLILPATTRATDNATSQKPAAAKKVLATVGKEKITEEDVMAPISMMPPQFRSRYETPDGRKKLFERAVQMSLLSQEARRRGIDKQEDVAKKIKEMADQIIIQELTKQVISDQIAVSDDEIQKYYNENTASFVEEERVKVNLIQFEVKDNATEQQKTEKKKQAEKALSRLKKGEDFEALAKELSDDKRTKTRGGNTGFFTRGKRNDIYGEAFEAKAFSLKPGEISDVFQGKNGYYIIKVAERKEQKQQTLDEAKPRIERTLKQEKQKKAFDDYIESLKKRYPVQIKDESLK